MYNTYISSTISLRSKGSLSFSFNDYSYYLSERFEKTPSTLSSSRCACCSLCIHRVPINPSLVYGLRQSSLLQWSASRRLILGAGDRFYCRVPVYGVERDCDGVTCCLKERSVSGRRERRGKGRFGYTVSDKKRVWNRLSGVNDAEVILSLLTEDVGEECFGVRERSGSLSKRVQVEKRGNDVDECSRGRKKNVESGSMGSNSKCEFESVTIKTREEGCRRNEEKEAFSRGGNHRTRKGGSSCSSYYSLSSSGDFESDTEVEVKHGGVVGETSNGYKKDSKRNGEVRFDAEVVEELERHRDDAVEHGEAWKQENTAVGSGVSRDWRKKSEKKFTEVSLEQTESRKESSQTHFGVSEAYKRGFGKASSSHKQFDDREEKLTLVGNLDEERRKQYSQTGSQDIGQSESKVKYQQCTEVPEIHGSDVETISSSQKRVGGREQNLSVAVNIVQETEAKNRGKCDRITGQDELRRNSQQPAETLKIQDSYIERASDLQRQSETRMKNRKEKATLVLSSVQEAKEQHHQTGEWIIGQVDSTKKSQQFSDLSEIHDSNVEKTSTSVRQSEGRMKKREGSLSMVFRSHPETDKERFQTDRKDIRRTESKYGSQDLTSRSVVHSSDTERVTNSQGDSEKRMSSQEAYLTSAVKSVDETRYRRNHSDERLMQTRSTKEAQRLSKLSSFHESTSEVTCSTQGSLDLVSQSGVQKKFVDERGKRSSQAIVTPPASQLVARGSLHIESTSGSATQEVSKETSESGFSSLSTHLEGKTPALHHDPYGGGRRGETYGEPLNLISPEDALGSADRFEKSSRQFIEEFVEKARHEVSSSEIQEENLSKTKLVNEGEREMIEGFRYGSEDAQSKEHDSRHSSGGSGTKGPSDEMWDVRDSSVKESPKTGPPEGTATTGNGVIRRTGRSLWSIMADIVRMRWGSRAENHNSAVKSGGKSSSNESVGSEAWFSGHEPDENNDENVKREKRSIAQESRSADQPQLGKTPTLSQREGSDSMSSKENIRHVEEDASSSSIFLESGSIFQGISPASGEENFGLNEGGKSFQGTPSSTATVESSLPLPARRIRRSPKVGEITDTSIADESGSGSMERMEQPHSVGLTEVSGTEGKDGELKRRKLQRNKQVPKDRFEEWEEAYKLESEQRKFDEMFMKEALLEAKKAADSWEVPVGAVLVQHGKIIARGCNLVEELRDSTAHAEMICIREASNLLQTWRLSEATLYVTLEPCPMCAGAILQARIDTLVWGAPNKLLGADGSWIRLFPNGGEGGNGSELTDKPPAPVHPFHPKMTIRRGVLASECADAMQQFFQLRRRKKEKEKKPDSPTPPSCLPVSNHQSKFLTKMHEIFNTMFCL